jgi:hypothetical protein
MRVKHQVRPKPVHQNKHCATKRRLKLRREHVRIKFRLERKAPHSSPTSSGDESDSEVSVEAEEPTGKNPQMKRPNPLITSKPANTNSAFDMDARDLFSLSHNTFIVP